MDWFFLRSLGSTMLSSRVEFREVRTRNANTVFRCCLVGESTGTPEFRMSRTSRMRLGITLPPQIRMDWFFHPSFRSAGFSLPTKFRGLRIWNENTLSRHRGTMFRHWGTTHVILAPNTGADHPEGHNFFIRAGNGLVFGSFVLSWRCAYSDIFVFAFQTRLRTSRLCNEEGLLASNLGQVHSDGHNFLLQSPTRVILRPNVRSWRGALFVCTSSIEIRRSYLGWKMVGALV